MEAPLQPPAPLRASRSSPGPDPSQGICSDVTDQDVAAAHGLQSPGIKVEFHGGASGERPLHGLAAAATRPAMFALTG